MIEYYLQSKKEEIQYGILYENIAHIIREGIRLDIIPKKSQIPPESVLEKIFTVSRVTVRKAMNILEAEGLIFREPGRGTFVQDTPTYNLMKNDSFYSTITKQNHHVQEKRIIDTVIESPVFITQVFKQENSFLCHHFLRIHYINFLPISLENVWIPCYLCPEDITFGISMYKTLEEHNLSPNNFHRKLFAELSTKQQSDFLEIALGTPLITLYQSAFLPTQELIEYSIINCRNGFYELVE